jgi:hypothetical protein
MLAAAAHGVKHQAFSTPNRNRLHGEGRGAGPSTFWRLIERRHAAVDPRKPIHPIVEIVVRELHALGLDALRAFLDLSGDGDARSGRMVRVNGPDDPPRALPQPGESFGPRSTGAQPNTSDTLHFGEARWSDRPRSCRTDARRIRPRLENARRGQRHHTAHLQIALGHAEPRADPRTANICTGAWCQEMTPDQLLRC